MFEIGLRDVIAARKRIRGIAAETPLVPSAISARAGAEVLLKLEIAQPTGAFKLRGAANAILQLSAAERDCGVVCSSTGNHGRAVAYAARAAGVRAVVCLSELVPPVKVAAIEALGAEVRRIGRSQDDAQIEVDRLAAEEGMIDIPPFDHPAIVAGQGTIGLELFEQRPDLANIVIPLSGGGLAGGIALAAKAINPAVRIVGITMDRGAAMYDSLRAGHPVDVVELPSLADSLGGGIGLKNRLTFALCRDLIDETLLVTEDEIYRGLRALILEDRLIAEGASAVSHAAVLAGKLKLDGPTAFILSGRSIGPEQFAAIVAGHPVQLGDLTVGGTNA
ncbi:MAG TPA: hydroxyectoine utilization dehydratase EutB [Thermohalobaculum sp.]|nr:hydroxyectoine utilization dehydratase EutB [Thermohalobaculum sp.]